MIDKVIDISNTDCIKHDIECIKRDERNRFALYLAYIHNEEEKPDYYIHCSQCNLTNKEIINLLKEDCGNTSYNVYFKQVRFIGYGNIEQRYHFDVKIKHSLHPQDDFESNISTKTFVLLST